MKTFASFRVTPAGIPNDGILFVDHSTRRRSGHLGHALVQCRDGEILAFYPNCNDDMKGHSGNGWMEFKRSHDGGETWGKPEKLPYSFDMWKSGCGRTAMSEKAVCTDDDTVVLFNLICDMQVNGSLWEPYWRPTVIRSSDHGRTWSEAVELCPLRGRVYDVLERQGVIYVLFFANDATEHYAGVKPEHVYSLYVSEDGGKSFSKRSDLSIDAAGRCYGTMEFLPDGSIIACVYDIHDEQHPDYCISDNEGFSWQAPQKTCCKKQIRNPQMARFGGGYFLHGRSGNTGEDANHFVIYYSDDAVHWDEGHYLRLRGPGAGGYSNNLVTGRAIGGPERLLIQTSHPYSEHRTNVIEWWIDES